MSALAKRVLELDRKFPGDPEASMDLPAKVWAELVELARGEAPKPRWSQRRDELRELVWHFGDYSVHVTGQTAGAKAIEWGVKIGGAWVLRTPSLVLKHLNGLPRSFRTLRDAKRFCETAGQSRSYSRLRCHRCEAQRPASKLKPKGQFWFCIDERGCTRRDRYVRSDPKAEGRS